MNESTSGFIGKAPARYRCRADNHKTIIMTIWAIVPAAGVGRRMGPSSPKDLPKQYRSILGRPVLSHSLQTLLTLPEIARVVVALHPQDRHFETLECANDTRISTVGGGSQRQDSVLNALDSLSEAEADDWVLVHDAVRPCVTGLDIRALINDLSDHPVGGLLAAPVDNTIKRVADNGDVEATVERSTLWNALTPQMFRFGILQQALRHAQQHHLQITDEASAVELAGHVPRVVQGSKNNIKITHEGDLALAEFILVADDESGTAVPSEEDND